MGEYREPALILDYSYSRGHTLPNVINRFGQAIAHPRIAAGVRLEHIPLRINDQATDCQTVV